MAAHSAKLNLKQNYNNKLYYKNLGVNIYFYYLFNYTFCLFCESIGLAEQETCNLITMPIVALISVYVATVISMYVRNDVCYEP